jgi:uncharacterized tellurite resistance protein B-like protein
MKIIASFNDDTVQYKKVSDDNTEEQIKQIEFKTLIAEQEKVLQSIGKRNFIQLIFMIIVGVAIYLTLKMLGLSNGISGGTGFGVFVLMIFYISNANDKKDKKNKTKLIYELDGHNQKTYDSLVDAFKKMISSDKVWEIISSEKVDDWKTSGGATASLDRVPLGFGHGLPSKIESNISPPYINFRKGIVYFLPEKILLKHAGEYHESSYSSINTRSDVSKFREEESIAQDTEVIGETWVYVNKNGKPDKRFKDNKKIPICRYEKIFLRVNGFKGQIMISKHGLGEDFLNTLSGYTDSFQYQNFENTAVESVSLENLKSIMNLFILFMAVDGDMHQKEKEIAASYIGRYWKDDYGDLAKFTTKILNEFCESYTSDTDYLADELQESTEILADKLSDKQKHELLESMKEIIEADDNITEEEQKLYNHFNMTFI